jgi:multidrug efflux pump subunit AcrB
LIGGCARYRPDAQSEQVLTIETVYPGASAKVVADAIASPIEQQIAGTEKLMQMRSQSRADGTFTLELVLDQGADLDLAMKLVQNRLALALPILPEAVREIGATLKIKSPGVVAILTLSSPDARYDNRYISNYAKLMLKDQLARVPGVDHLSLVAGTEPTCRIWPDANKMAPHGVSAADIAQAVEPRDQARAAEKNTGQASDRKPSLPLMVDVSNGFAGVEEIASRVVKTDRKHNVVRVRDVAEIDWRFGQQSSATFNRAPVIAIAVYPTRQARPRDVRVTLAKTVSQIKTELAQGLRLEVDFDFTANLGAPDRPTTPEYLLVEVHSPDAASTQRVQQTLSQCENILRNAAGVQDTLSLTLTDSIFPASPGSACVLVRLGPNRAKGTTREELITTIRTRLGAELPESLVRIRDLAGHSRFPSCEYPIAVAVVDAGDEGIAAMNGVAERLATRLGQIPWVQDAMASRAALPRNAAMFEIDLRKAEVLSVSEWDMVRTLQTYLGSVPWDVTTGPGYLRLIVQPLVSAREPDELLQLKARASDGRMVPIAAVAQIRKFQDSRVIERLDGVPMVPITADFSPSIRPADARARYERAVEEFELPGGFQLKWLARR